MRTDIDIVFDGAPDHDGARFVEVESPSGTSIRFGTWVKRTDGYWVLRFRVFTIVEIRESLAHLNWADREHVFDRLGLTPYQREQD